MPHGDLALESSMAAGGTDDDSFEADA